MHVQSSTVGFPDSQEVQYIMYMYTLPKQVGQAGQGCEAEETVDNRPKVKSGSRKGRCFKRPAKDGIVHTHCPVHMYTLPSTHVHIALYTCTHCPVHMYTLPSTNVHIAQYTCAHCPVHMYTLPSTHVHIAQYTCTHCPVHMYTLPSTHVHIAQYTCTHCPVHMYTLPSTNVCLYNLCSRVWPMKFCHSQIR